MLDESELIRKNLLTNTIENITDYIDFRRKSGENPALSRNCDAALRQMSQIFL